MFNDISSAKITVKTNSAATNNSQSLETASRFNSNRVQEEKINDKPSSKEQAKETSENINATNSLRPDVEKLKEQQQEIDLQSKKSLLESMFAKGSKGDAKAMQIFYQEATLAIENYLRQELDDEEFSLERLREKTSGLEGQEDYWSSENTADRIITFATSYYETFKKQNPRLNDEEVMEKYMNLVQPALEKGIGEAINVLEGFGAFHGHIKDTAEETQRLVFEKLEAFRENKLGLNKETDEAEKSSSVDSKEEAEEVAAAKNAASLADKNQ